jgi:tungstate transport system substrate-binding protein
VAPAVYAGDVPPRAARGLIVVLTALAGGCTTAEPSRLIAVATTTSVDNSGLLNVLLPAFESETGITVRVVTPGSGIALSMLQRGDVDVAISHAPVREAELGRDSRTWLYKKIMFNDFLIVGPPHDPAHVRDATTAADAMRAIATSGVRFISRGDSSGTHERERHLWSKAGITPTREQAVIAGSGMGATLRIAATMSAYTLTDRATFAHHAERGDLNVVFQGGPDLVNTYAVIARVDAPLDARAFAAWLTDGDGRRLIAGYTMPAGAPAFMIWPAGCPRDSPADVPCGATAH